MFLQPLPLFLFASLLNFLLKISLFAAKHFKVDIEPPADLQPLSCKILFPLKDPLPIVEKKDYRKILAKAEAQGKPISPVRRINLLSVDVDKCTVCGAPANYLYSFGKDPEGFQKLQCKCVNTVGLLGLYLKSFTLLIAAPSASYVLSKDKTRKNFTVLKCRNDNCPKWLNLYLCRETLPSLPQWTFTIVFAYSGGIRRRKTRFKSRLNCSNIFWDTQSFKACFWKAMTILTDSYIQPTSRARVLADAKAS